MRNASKTAWKSKARSWNRTRLSRCLPTCRTYRNKRLDSIGEHGEPVFYVDNCWAGLAQNNPSSANTHVQAALDVSLSACCRVAEINECKFRPSEAFLYELCAGITRRPAVPRNWTFALARLFSVLTPKLSLYRFCISILRRNLFGPSLESSPKVVLPYFLFCLNVRVFSYGD
jgi:hypothetical protein